MINEMQPIKKEETRIYSEVLRHKNDGMTISFLHINTLENSIINIYSFAIFLLFFNVHYSIQIYFPLTYIFSFKF